MEKLSYNGPQDINAVHVWAAKQSEGKKYVMVAIVFSEVFAHRTDKLTSSDHAANDYHNGYWYDGVRKTWSESRKIRAQNAGQTND